MSRAPSEFAGIPQAPPDPILGVTEAFKACNAVEKLNLGVGAYRNDKLQPVVLEARRCSS
jgi:aspartate aminotransferase